MKSIRVAASAAFLALSIVGAQSQEPPTVPLTVETRSGTHVFQVEVADEPQERSKGLMFRRQMEADSGMFFDFGVDREVSMWMKNTYLPLDMLFIEADGEILSIARRTTPLSEKTISSGGPVHYVLEINGGRAKELGIEPGDIVSGPPLKAK